MPSRVRVDFGEGARRKEKQNFYWIRAVLHYGCVPYGSLAPELFTQDAPVQIQARFNQRSLLDKIRNSYVEF